MAATLVFIAAAAFLARTIAATGWRSLWERLAAADPLLVALSAIAVATRYAAWGKRWQLLLRPVARAAWWRAQRALLSSVFFYNIIPAGRPAAGLIRARQLGRGIGQPTAPVYGVVLVDQVGYSLLSLVLSAHAVPVALWPAGSRRHPAATVAAAAAASVGALLLLWWRRESIARRIRRRIPSAVGTVEAALGSARLVLSRARSYAVILIGGSAAWYGGALSLFFASRAVGADLGMGAAAAAWALGSTAGIVSGSPGGAGVAESAALVPLVAMGIPPDRAISAILIARLFEYAVGILVGGACALAEARPRGGATA